MEKIKFEWKIRDFSKRKGTLTTRIFPTSAPERLGKWRLELFCTHNCPDQRGSSISTMEMWTNISGVSIVLYQETSTVSSAKVILSLMDDKGAVARQEVREYSKDKIRERLTHLDFVFTRAGELLPNDELTVVCEIGVQVEDPSVAKCEPPPCRLVHDLGQLLASRSLSDVTIALSAGGGAELRAHKAVLAARSPVFAAMFTNPMLEKETGVVEITDVDADVFQAVLEFIYTGEVEVRKRWAHNLLAAATKYQLERLRVMCEDALCRDLALDNVLENLALADLYGAAELRKRCVSFVTEHRALILRSPSWETFKLSHQSLVMEILENICLPEQNFNFSDCSDEVIEGKLPWLGT